VRPSTQRLDGSPHPARQARQRQRAEGGARPSRVLAGFCGGFPTADPKSGGDELERTVTRMGFKGAMVHGPTNGVFFDDKRFWPIFERAQALDVPL